MHVTHYDKAAKIISKNTEYIFNANKKPMQDRRNYTIADAAGPICDNIHYKPSTDDTFPGYLSWWSLDLQADLPNLDDKFRTADPTYLFQSQDEQKSRYGNVKFSANLKVIVEAYKKYFKAEKVEVRFKRAGTLRYVQEIEYLIIVCAVIDGNDSFPQYESLQPGDDCWLHITKPRHISKASWDHYAIAFHFPPNVSPVTTGRDDQPNIKIKKKEVSICDKVIHATEICVRKTHEDWTIRLGNQCNYGTKIDEKKVKDEITNRADDTGLVKDIEKLAIKK